MGEQSRCGWSGAGSVPAEMMVRGRARRITLGANLSVFQIRTRCALIQV